MAAPPCDAFSYAWVFDPFDDRAVQGIVDALGQKGASFKIEVHSGASVGSIGHREDSAKITNVKGLAYRAATPVAITVVKVDQTANPGPGAPAAPPAAGGASAPAATPSVAGASAPAPRPPAAGAPGATAPVAVAGNPGMPAPMPVSNAAGAPDPLHPPGQTGAPAKAAPAAPKQNANAAALPAPPAASGCKLASSPSAQSWQAIVPDTRTHYHVSSLAGPFTTTSLAFGFTDGMLTDYSVQRPSEVAAIAGIPVRIANDIMTIPTNLIRLRVDYDTASVARINGDANVKAAQVQQAATLAAAEMAVVNAQAALSSARISEKTSLANAQTALVNTLEQLRAARATAATNSAAASSP